MWEDFLLWHSHGGTFHVSDVFPYMGRLPIYE
jgi:hypothetical protein